MDKYNLSSDILEAVGFVLKFFGICFILSSLSPSLQSISLIKKIVAFVVLCAIYVVVNAAVLKA